MDPDQDKEQSKQQRRDFLKYDQQQIHCSPPASRRETPVHSRAFYTMNGVIVDSLPDRPPVVLDLLTTEEFVIDLTPEVALAPNRNANRRMIDYFARIEKARPGTKEEIYKLAELNPDHKGVAILAHGKDYPELDIPFGMTVSQDAINGKGGVVPVEVVLSSIQNSDVPAYILLFACNPGGHKLDPAIAKCPIFYYLTDNAPTMAIYDTKVEVIYPPNFTQPVGKDIDQQ